AALCLAALWTLAACATSPGAPITRHYPPAPYNTPPNGEIYASAPFAPLHSELMACNAYGSNLGALGERGEALAYTPYLFTAAGALMRNPTESACLSSGFGWRNSMGGEGREHAGLDLANPHGGFIYAAGDGWVSFAGWRGGYGNALELDHGHGVRSFYAHMAELDPRLQQGMFVPARAPIGRMGRTGNATGVHLHYEVIVDGQRVDPLRYGVLEEAPIS
ncbi:MAG TPA: M23 family metallopeptidase, partial [Terricaulis sp.]|nr:M23 family metallopeptidase [Terricaulis sp.]